LVSSFANHSRVSKIRRMCAFIVFLSSTAATALTSAARFTGYGGIALLTKSKESRRAITPPSRKLANPAAFENVLATNRFGYFRIHGIAVSPEYSAYASSNTTAVCGAASNSRLNSGKGTSVPVGLFGFAKKKTRGRFRNASRTSDRGNRIFLS